MGFGAWGVRTWAMKYQTLKELLPDAVAKVESLPLFDSVGWGEIAFEEESELWRDTDPRPDSFTQLLEDLLEAGATDSEAWPLYCRYKDAVAALRSAFEEKTWLTLELRRADEADGRYDEPYAHDTCVFAVDGVQQFTPAGNHWKSHLVEARWVEYG